MASLSTLSHSIFGAVITRSSIVIVSVDMITARQISDHAAREGDERIATMRSQRRGLQQRLGPRCAPHRHVDGANAAVLSPVPRRLPFLALLRLAACGHAGTAAVNTAPIAPLLPALLEDAARRTALPASRLRVASLQAVVWRDGALGCPQPGWLYTQALVPGYCVRIAAIDGASVGALDYHVSERGGWLHCPAGQALKSASPATDGV